MGASETKEQPRTVTFDNQLLMTEAALQQLQSSVGKSVPQVANTGSSNADSSKLLNDNRPLPSIQTTATVETWRALSSSVNDTELQRLREEYKQKLLEQDRFNREKLKLTKENLASELEKVEKKFSKYIYSPICEIERSDIEQCYLSNPKQVLTCSTLAEKFIKCVQQHREQALRVSQTNNNKEISEQHGYADPLSAKTSPDGDSN